jgi:hypothetical protein
MSAALTLAVAAFFALMGLYALARPRAVLEPFGVRVDSSAGRNEVRAVYGGFGLAVAGVLVAAALFFQGDLRRGVLLAIAVSLAGMALGRLVSRALEPLSAFYPAWFYFLVEVALSAALAVAANG